MVDPYAQDLAKAASALAAAAGGSEDAYFEAGYFLIYATMRGWRLGLGLEPGQTTERVLWTEFQLVATLVGQSIGQPFSGWEKLGPEEESGLMELSTSYVSTLPRQTCACCAKALVVQSRWRKSTTLLSTNQRTIP